MEKNIIAKLNKKFEEYACEQDGVEYWLARELQELLEYTQWRNFSNVIEKAKEACTKSGNTVADHFADVSKMIDLGKGEEPKLEPRILIENPEYSYGDSESENNCFFHIFLNAA